MVDSERLVEAWDPYHELFSWAPLGYARLTFEGRICEMNYTGADLLEVTTEGVVGQPLVAYVANADRRSFLDHLGQARGTSETIEAEIELRSAGGHHFPVRICTRRSPRREESLCWTIFLDLSEHHRLSNQRRRAEDPQRHAQDGWRIARPDNDTKDRFVAALSHELRTPLTPVLMATSLLSSLEGLPAPAATIIETIRRNVEREARLIDNLLDVTRLTRHTMVFDRQMVDAHGLLRDAIAACSAEAGAKGLDITLQASAPDARVNADPIRMRQAFQHLLTNAVQFTESGQVSIVTSNARPDMLRIAIADSGAGLTSDELAGLFRPFEPRESRGAGSSLGLGLGLTISQGIVEAHGGRVAASSPGPGCGATFEVQLPVAGPRSDPPASESGTAPNTESDRRRSAASPLRILVVEDHTDSGAMLDLLLTSRGHTVIVATSVATALSRRDEHWDVVISDLGLPDGSGLEVGRVMRALPHPPRLIALSGYGRPSDVAASQQAGFDIHLVKPLEPDRLFEILESGR